jgi:alkylation response protein AidB-like acyl-CoA dehydrogenase
MWKKEANMAQESEKLQALRQEVRTWLKENLPEGWGTPDYVRPTVGTEEAHIAGRAWQKKLYDAGYTGFEIPKEYGGVERSREEQVVIREEMSRTGTPAGSGGLAYLAVAALLRHGTEEQKKRWLPKIANGEESWCECFSEPNAGSDLANIQKTAVKDGDDWVINGQSVWTSGSQFADWGLCPAVTEPDAPRHRNLSFFFFDCKTPGFMARPLKQMTGDAQFGETFFDDVRVPQFNMIGDQGRGWYVAMTVLEAERGGGMRIAQPVAPRAAEAVTNLGGVENLVELAKNTKRRGKTAWEDPIFRDRIAQLAIENEAMRAYGARLRVMAQKRQTTGNEQSLTSVYRRERGQRQANLTAEIMGANIQFMRGDKRALNDGSWTYTFLRCRGNTIETGTTEINRNIIAERILGLPRTRR